MSVLVGLGSGNWVGVFFFFFGPLLFCVLSSTTGVSGTYVLTYSNHCD